MLFIIPTIKSSPNLIINEIMYDPIENDNYYEWIELYNPTNQSINVSGWSITDNSGQDLLVGDSDHGNSTTIIPPDGYAIIVDQGSLFFENYSIPNSTIKLYVDDSSIGNGLGNSGDKLILKNETGDTIDAVEWIINYDDVPGDPAFEVKEGSSLSRNNCIDLDNSSIDFIETETPTPGNENLFFMNSILNIDLYPLFLPKIQNNSQYSLPFAVRINISNYEQNKTYEIKTYVVGNLSSTYPATQTWDGGSWEYSNYYTTNIKTDSYGNYTGWQFIRFNSDYSEYQNEIKNNNFAYLKLKIKYENSSDETKKIVNLLDIDNSTINGTIGGYAVGRVSTDNTYLEEKIVIIENETGNITGIYITENNKIDDDFIAFPGYFKVASPVGVNNTIRFLNYDSSEIYSLQNITIRQGKFGLNIKLNKDFYQIKRHDFLDILLTIENIGDFNDNYKICITQITDGWQCFLEKEEITLESNEGKNVNLHVIPCQNYGCNNGFIKIKVFSESDICEFEELILNFEIFAPDLTITKIITYNEEDINCNVFGEGEIVKIKAYLKNNGNDNATNVTVGFYLDDINNSNLIGEEFYNSISKYQKYPSIYWDAKNVEPGAHKIFVVADEINKIEELIEDNNKYVFEVNIYKTYPDKTILLKELYYNTHPNLDNEYIAVFNPSNNDYNISGWIITNNPFKKISDQSKIVFPNNTVIPKHATIYITQNSSAFEWEIGKLPDFEYSVDSNANVPQMLSKKKFTLANIGGIVALKDFYNHTIDVIVYGEEFYNSTGWVNSSVLDSGKGVVLKRNSDDYGFLFDTNTSSDWINSRTYGIGQSNFLYEKIHCEGELKTFVSPDCSFNTIVDEIRNANSSIYLNIYEFNDPFLCNELISALKKDVSVFIYAEGCPIGGLSDEEKYILKRINNYGGNIRFIINDNDNNVYKRYNFDHAKYLVIDNKTIIVESCNWAKTGIPKDTTYGNREWGIIVGNKTLAEYFLKVFFDDWNPKRCDSISFYDMDLSLPLNYYINEIVYSGNYEPNFVTYSYNGNFTAIPVFSPDTSYKAIIDMIDSANESIYIEQLYIYKDWGDKISPFVEKLIEKSKLGLDIRVIINYNKQYEETNDKINFTKKYLEDNNIKVKFIYSNWSYFSNVHNKGMIVDNRSVLISSINWNENSVSNNREAGIIIENEEISKYYLDVFLYDWNLTEPNNKNLEEIESSLFIFNKNTIYIIVIFTLTFALIARDWRNRQWT